MTSWKRFLLGGLGALSIVILWGATADFETIVKAIGDLRRDGAAFDYVLGYFVRGVCLFIAGGIAASVFNADENKPGKLFQLGMAGPAVLAAFIGVTGLAPQSAQITPHSQSAYASLIGAAHAQPSEAIRVTKYPSLVVTGPEKFARGFLAKKAVKRRFYVIVGSRDSREDAVKLAETFSKDFPKFRYHVYEPNKGRHYGVSVGSATTFDEADKLRQKAQDAGFPDRPYVTAVP